MGNNKIKTMDVPVYTELDYKKDQDAFDESIKNNKLNLSSFRRLMTHDLCTRTNIINTGCINKILIELGRKSREIMGLPEIDEFE